MDSESSTQRVLIYRLGSLGDTTVALPCFHLIARKYPLATRLLLTNYPVHAKAPASAAVLGASGLIHGYMRYTVGTRSPVSLLRLAFEIRRFRPQVLVYLMPARTPRQLQRDLAFFRFACGAKRVVGAGQAAETSSVFDAATGRYESEAFRLARVLSELGEAEPSQIGNWDLRLTEEEKTRAGAVLEPFRQRPFFVCGPGTKMQAKDWGEANWLALMKRLSQQYPDHGLALVGAAEDKAVSDAVAAGWAGPTVNLCGQLSPRETAAVLEGARVFLGPDSGPMHLAASVGVPAVIAFSARGLPGVWFPIGDRNQVIYHQTSCYGCNLETCIEQQRRCLTSITIDEMVSAVQRALQS
uniref:Glycosyltransferase family 9 protein n=1 Tax=mine drainage metagenome TaxID=410659 RepID=E6QI11_9ZZZZ